MSTVDDSLSALVILLSLVLGLALYIWTALALAAMFRKMGEQAWKGWVPFLNQAIVLKAGGFSPWLVLLLLIPGAGALAVWILTVVAAHRINPGFGYGGGMTVLAALLFVVWASILGFGPARWLGAHIGGPAPARPAPTPEPAATAALFAPPEQRAAEPAPTDTSAWEPPAEPGAPSGGPAWPAPAPAEPAAAPAGPGVPAGSSGVPVGSSGEPAWPAASPAGPAAPLAGPTGAWNAEGPNAGGSNPGLPNAGPDAGPEAAASAPAAYPPAAGPASGALGDEAAPGPLRRSAAVPPASSTPAPPPAARPAASPASGHVNAQGYLPPPRITSQPASSAPDATLPFAPVRPVAEAAGEATAPADESVDSWGSEIDDVSAVSPAPFPPSGAASQSYVPAPVDTSEPIAFVPGRKPAVPPRDDAPVTRAPAPPTRRRSLIPSSPDYDPDAFPEMSGEVSAVVGSPAAGTPLSARHSVSAQEEHSADSADDFDEIEDQTVIARRKRAAWQLIPASGTPIALTADVVILGRQPAPDPARPRAQLVSLDDRTRTVSKTHARLELKADGWHLTDLHSTNGVLLPTVLGTEIEIEPGSTVPAGDRFLLGDAELRLTRGEA